jgi:hypothetical protein
MLEKRKGGTVWLGDRFQGGKASEAATDQSSETAGNTDKFPGKRGR